MSLLRSPKRTPVPTAEGEEAEAERSRGYGATAGSGEPTQRSQSFSESFSEAASEAWHRCDDSLCRAVPACSAGECPAGIGV